MVDRGLSERRALRAVRMSASAFRYEPRPDRNVELRATIQALAQRHKRYIHLHTIDISPGISVLPGFQVGTMNCTGSCSSAVYGQNHVAGTHLHLEVAAYVGAPRTPEGRLDPEALMSACE